MSLDGARREFGLGAAIGTAAFLVVVRMLWGSGTFQVDGINHWRVLLSPIAELTLVAFFEEILFRGILLRILESWIGRMPSLFVSVCLLALAHLPNEGISLQGIAVKRTIANARSWPLCRGLHSGHCTKPLTR